MKELWWGVIALIVLLTLTLITLGLRSVPLNKTGLGVSNVFEDGLLFGIFAICFAPVYLAWMGTRSIYFRLWPAVALPTEGDDPVWSRKINRQVVETAFLAVQQARMKQNPDLAKKFISKDLYRRLRRDCKRADAETRSHGQVKIKEIVFADERIENALCYFNATVSAVISTGESDDNTEPKNQTEEFAAQLEFARALPEVHDARWQLMTMSGLYIARGPDRAGKKA